MSGTADRSLFLRPLEGIQAEGWPVMRGIATRMNLFFQSEQAEVSGAVRSETGYLDVVPEQVRVAGDWIRLSGEELLLVVEAGSPSEVGSDLEIFAYAMSHHVGGMNAFGRVDVVGATGCMDVMVAGPPTGEGRIDPALHAEGLGLGLLADLKLKLLPD